MSENKFKQNIFYKYFKLKNLLICFVLFLFLIPFIFIFISIKRTWADGMSVAAIFYIGISLLAIIFNEAKFKTFSKLKNLFTIKKENKEPFTKFEKAQMSALNINSNIEKKNFDKKNFLFISVVMLIYGIILLSISLPFIF